MAAAGAFYWINESDIIIGADDVQIFDPHVSRGWVAAVEPTGLLGRIHLGEIMRIALMGSDERIGAQTALRIGLISEIVTRDELWARAHQIAAAIASKPPRAVQGTVRAVWEGRNLPPSLAVTNAFKYAQLGNPATAQQYNSIVRKSEWVLR